MAIVFEQIETSAIEAPVSTAADQQGSDKSAPDAGLMRRTLEVMTERAARLGVD
jgi:hypothetical protein